VAGGIESLIYNSSQNSTIITTDKEDMGSSFLKAIRRAWEKHRETLWRQRKERQKAPFRESEVFA
jgi:hypothetical protein